MKITKFVHSCLLIETDGEAVLFDPGVFSPLNIEALPKLSTIFITHEHADHMDVAQVQKLQTKFQSAQIIAPAGAKNQLETAGITNVSSAAPEGVSFFEAPHEEIAPLGWGPQPDELGIHYLDQFSDPGDSHTFTETKPVLALPIQAPWGSTVEAVKVALDLKPKYIIPVHDWHWNDDARQQMYDRLEQRFAGVGITFFKMADGQPVEVNL